MPSSEVMGQDEAWGPFYGISREVMDEASERHISVMDPSSSSVHLSCSDIEGGGVDLTRQRWIRWCGGGSAAWGIQGSFHENEESSKAKEKKSGSKGSKNVTRERGTKNYKTSRAATRACRAIWFHDAIRRRQE